MLPNKTETPSKQYLKDLFQSHLSGENDTNGTLTRLADLLRTVDQSDNQSMQKIAKALKDLQATSDSKEKKQYADIAYNEGLLNLFSLAHISPAVIFVLLNKLAGEKIIEY